MDGEASRPAATGGDRLVHIRKPANYKYKQQDYWDEWFPEEESPANLQAKEKGEANQTDDSIAIRVTPSDRVIDLLAKVEFALNSHSTRSCVSQLIFRKKKKRKAISDFLMKKTVEELGLGLESKMTLEFEEHAVRCNYEDGVHQWMAHLEHFHMLLSAKEALGHQSESSECAVCVGLSTRTEIVSYFGGNNLRCPRCKRTLVHDIGN